MPEGTTPEGTTGVVLLAAGLSSRFEGDKLSADFNGKPLCAWAAQACEAAGFAKRVIVVAERTCIQPDRSEWDVVLNPHPEEGLSSSIRAGVAAAAAKCDRVVLALADMPFVTADHLRRLADETGTVFTRQNDGRPGVPAGFPSRDFGRLLSLSGDRGAAAVAGNNAKIVEPSTPGMLSDVDTRADLVRFARDAVPG